MSMLELNKKPNIWNPPAVDAVGLAIDIRNDYRQGKEPDYENHSR